MRSCRARRAASSAWRRPRGAAGFDRVIGFDMGGTSTDVSLYAGAYERDNDSVVAGVRIRAPMLRIHTVAAGGGSICRVDGRAGAGRAGERRRGAGAGLLPARRAADDHRLQRDAGQAAAAILSGDLRRRTATSRSTRDAVHGAVRGAIRRSAGPRRRASSRSRSRNMANAIKAISVARGHDAARFALACFGGAGGQHACLVADALEIDDGADPPAGGGAVGLWHGAGRAAGDARADDRAAAGEAATWPRRSRI